MFYIKIYTLREEYKMTNEKLTELMIEGIKTAISHVLEEYVEEDIYILSLQADNHSTPDGDYTLTFYVNTEENHAQNMVDLCDDPWYYRFCEYEWYVMADSPEYFDKALEYINSADDEVDGDDVYECIVQAVVKLREDGYFESVFPHFVFFSVEALEYFEPDDIIDMVVRMNGKENFKDYIANSEAFL